MHGLLICIIHITGVSLCLISASRCLFFFLQICTNCPPLVLHSTEMSIRMLANLYKRLTTTTNALPTIRKAYDWLNMLQIVTNMLQIYAFLANYRSLFLISVTPQNRARMLMIACECVAITLRSLRIGGELHL